MAATTDRLVKRQWVVKKEITLRQSQNAFFVVKLQSQKQDFITHSFNISYELT